MSREIAKLYCYWCKRVTDLRVDKRVEDMMDANWMCPVCGVFGRVGSFISFKNLEGVIFVEDEQEVKEAK
jgi:formate dehydrogenase maturation protein FdhE